MLTKKLGKKQAMNNGTLQAFSCPCNGCTPICSCKSNENRTNKYYGYWAKLNNLSMQNDLWF